MAVTAAPVSTTAQPTTRPPMDNWTSGNRLNRNGVEPIISRGVTLRVVSVSTTTSPVRGMPAATKGLKTGPTATADVE